MSSLKSSDGYNKNNLYGGDRREEKERREEEEDNRGGEGGGGGGGGWKRLDRSVEDWRAILSPSIAFFGVQLIMALENGDGSAYISELGLSERNLGYAWFAAPMLGLVLQPCVGAWSDRCTSKYGRRRPFIAIFGCFLVVLCIIFSNAKSIGEWMGDHSDNNDSNNNNDDDDDDNSHRPVALTIALICLFLIDLTINCLEGPLRALISDTCDEQQQLESNSFFGAQNGLAQAIGYLLVAVTFATALSWGIGAILLVLCLIFTLVLVKEKSIDTTIFHQMRSDQTMEQNNKEVVVKNNEENNNLDENTNTNTNTNTNANANASNSLNVTEEPKISQQVLKEIWWGWKNVPDVILRCIHVHLCAFIGFYCMWIYLADFYGRSIYDGRANASEHTKSFNRYERGVSAANYAYLSMSLVSALCALALDPLTKRFGLKPVWATCLATAGVSLLVTPAFIGGPVGAAIAVHSLIGVGLCASFSLPWAIVTKYSLLYDQSRSGLWSTIFNSSECIAEIFVSLTAGGLIEAFHHSPAIVMVLGGIFLLAGSLLVMRVKDDSAYLFEYQEIATNEKQIEEIEEASMQRIQHNIEDDQN